VGLIPDSLISEFKTKNGRTVKDGGGIAPDIESIPETLSQIAGELYLRNFIFDYATIYFWAHQGLQSPDQFNFTDQDYEDFRNYLTSRNFSYRTITEMSLNELITNAKREKYYDIHEELFSELAKELRHTLDDDLKTFRNEITGLLEDEIIGRYFYEAGSIEWTIKTDEQVLKALEILNAAQDYNSILKGKKGSILITHDAVNPLMEINPAESHNDETNI
jgi:carboxyl-terminal processing protease